MTTRWIAFVAAIRNLATHRVTYRFLGLLLVAFGVAQGGPFGEAFGYVVCVLLVGCDG
ncbi:gp19.5 family protein [Pseudomonas helmanticensis]|uniref:gp19.5 family protein n=1 Tax=Pseudomonas helmanticensis TaxID=1471381 RepID=UPI003D278556